MNSPNKPFSINDPFPPGMPECDPELRLEDAQPTQPVDHVAFTECHATFPVASGWRLKDAAELVDAELGDRVISFEMAVASNRPVPPAGDFPNEVAVTFMVDDGDDHVAMRKKIAAFLGAPLSRP